MSLSSDPKARGIASIAHLFLSEMQAPAHARRRPPVSQDEPEPAVSFLSQLEHEVMAGHTPSTTDSPPIPNEKSPATAADTAKPCQPQDTNSPGANAFATGLRSDTSQSELDSTADVELDEGETSFLDPPNEPKSQIADNTFLVFVEPRRESILEAYKTIKGLLQDSEEEPAVSVLVHQAKNHEQGRDVFQRLSQACLNFLEFIIESAGIITQDNPNAEHIEAVIKSHGAQGNFLRLRNQTWAELLAESAGIQAPLPKEAAQAPASSAVESQPQASQAAVPPDRLAAPAGNHPAITSSVPPCTIPNDATIAAPDITIRTPQVITDFPGDNAALRDILISRWGLWQPNLNDRLLIPLSQMTGQPSPEPAWLTSDPQGRLVIFAAALKLTQSDWYSILNQQHLAQQRLSAFAARFAQLRLDPHHTIGLLVITAEAAETYQPWRQNLVNIPLTHYQIHFLQLPAMKAMLVL